MDPGERKKKFVNQDEIIIQGLPNFQRVRPDGDGRRYALTGQSVRGGTRR
jgi:hypothetical protein